MIIKLGNYLINATTGATTTITGPGTLHHAVEIGGDGNYYFNGKDGLWRWSGSGSATKVHSSTGQGLPTMYMPPIEEPDIQEVGPFCDTASAVDLHTYWVCSGLSAEDTVDNKAIGQQRHLYQGTGITDDKKGTKVYFDNKIKLHLNYLNTTQAINVIATISIVKQLKLNLEKTFKAVANIEPLPGRGQIIKVNFNQDYKTFVIDDSYNANPDSMKAALSNFHSLKTKFKNYQTILIIGDMLELGRISKKSHKELIPRIKKINPHILITLGHYTNYICKELSPSIKCNPYYSIEMLLEDIKKILKPKQLILIKGSNGTELWKLVPFFKNHQEEDNAA